MKFEASWCNPCKQLSSVLDAINPNIEIQLFDADENSDVFREFNVRSVPTLILVQDGEELKRTSGTMSEAALRIFLEN